ncbi:hypothetical protein [Phaeobacter sp. JH20_18]|uniref:hypothetical protein n=1 Tax=Phaeobacter sp. JH20_18 TaxID=3112476 RepID=UPI003A8B4356
MGIGLLACLISVGLVGVSAAVYFFGEHRLNSIAKDVAEKENALGALDAEEVALLEERQALIAELGDISVAAGAAASVGSPSTVLEGTMARPSTARFAGGFDPADPTIGSMAEALKAAMPNLDLHTDILPLAGGRPAGFDPMMIRPPVGPNYPKEYLEKRLGPAAHPEWGVIDYGAGVGVVAGENTGADGIMELRMTDGSIVKVRMIGAGEMTIAGPDLMLGGVDPTVTAEMVGQRTGTVHPAARGNMKKRIAKARSKNTE